jgi:hypothetical protein
MRGLPTVAAASAAGVILFLPAPSGAHVDVSAGKLPCTVLIARDRILASSLPQSVKNDAAGMNGGGVDRLICRDVTYDGRPDMTALITSSWSTGVTAWVVFRAKTMWSLALARVHVHSAAGRYRRGDLVETQPVKSGGYDHRRFHWQRRHFVVLRKWHTKQP